MCGQYDEPTGYAPQGYYDPIEVEEGVIVDYDDPRVFVPRKPEFVPPHKAYQHLNRDGEQMSLCGYPAEDIFEPVFHDHRDGFDPNGGPACQRCADAGDRLQNGR